MSHHLGPLAAILWQRIGAAHVEDDDKRCLDRPTVGIVAWSKDLTVAILNSSAHLALKKVVAWHPMLDENAGASERALAARSGDH